MEGRVFGVDEQDAHPVDVTRWVRLAQHVLADEKVPPACELTLLFVDEAMMAELNGRHMAASGPTDVLAFPIDDPGVEPGRWPDNGTSGPDRAPLDADEVPALLGDVVVCPAVAARQAPGHADEDHHGGTLEDELALLVVHGILHVLGMDHATPPEETKMRARERALLAEFHHRS